MGGGVSEEKLRSSSLNADEARKLAQDFIGFGLQLLSTLTGRSPGPEELAKIMRIGMTVQQTLGPILGEFASPSDQTDASDLEWLSSHPIEAMKQFENELSKSLRKAKPEEVVKMRAVVDKMKEWSQEPTWPRKALIAFAKHEWQRKPGPTPKVPRDVYPEIAAKGDALRPVCEMVLELAQNKSKQPLPRIIEAVTLLHPEWQVECSFMLNQIDLLKAALSTAKFRRAKGIRSKAHILADALACTYAGHPASPSYSIQIVGEAQRLR